MMIMKKILITLILCLKMSNFVESKKSNIEDSGSSDNVRGDPTPIFKFVAKDDSLSSHREFGNVIGNTFKDKIVARLSQDSDLANAYEYCVNTSEGKQVYEEFLDAHERVYPKYVEELRGIASGAEVDFRKIFVKNLILEIDTIRSSDTTTYSVDHCSDYQMCTKEFCGVGHNEDDSEVSLNHTAIIIAEFPSVNFTGFTYLGDLTSGAFGFNSNGIAFTLNWVGPNNVQRGGLGQGFVSRSLMEATSFQDAISRVTIKNQCAGHNIQLMDVENRRVVNIETAPGFKYAIQDIEAPYFHANQYELLKIEEHFGNSSTHRIARVKEMPVPKDAASILSVLGDQNDTQYPIFHDVLSHERGELSDWTMATALFDLDAKMMKMFHGNPKRGDVMYTFSI